MVRYESVDDWTVKKMKTYMKRQFLSVIKKYRLGISKKFLIEIVVGDMFCKVEWVKVTKLKLPKRNRKKSSTYT